MENKPKKIAIISIFGWFAGIFFIFFGFVGFLISFIGGLFFILAGLILIPKTNTELKRRFNIGLSKNMRGVLALVLVAIAMFTFSLTKETSERTIETPEPIKSQAEQKAEEYVESQKKLDCTDQCTSPSCDDYDYINCLSGIGGCKYENNEGKIIGKCSIECLENNNCKITMECKDYKCVEKQKTQTVIEEEKSDFQKSLEILKEKLEDNRQMTLKLDECTKACAGEDYNLPYIKDEWYSVCYQLYYYLGLEEVDKQIIDCKNK